jgi:TatD DNase family protein
VDTGGIKLISCIHFPDILYYFYAFNTRGYFHYAAVPYWRGIIVLFAVSFYGLFYNASFLPSLLCCCISPDIGVNLTDPVFRGIYHGKTWHECDISSVFKRARRVGVEAMLLTSGTLEEYHQNKGLLKEYQGVAGVKLLTTVGVHPTRSLQVQTELEKTESASIDSYFAAMKESLSDEDLVAVGECGLDYARLEFSPRDVQLSWFERHFDLLSASSRRLPMFLHMREACQDFVNIVRRNRDVFERAGGGVAHSYTGSVADAKVLLEVSSQMYIGLNGCSLRDETGIEVARMLPVDRILLDSDAPWCEMRSSHASARFRDGLDSSLGTAKPKEKFDPDCPVRSRNEPASVKSVLQVLARIKEVPEEELAAIIYENTLRLFPNCLRQD